jgi:5'-methylthioinosine phosphorylase
MLAVIGGSGLSKFDGLEDVRREVVRTPYGEPSGALTFGRIGGSEVAFLARHGYGHTIPPHMINYRANLWALQTIGAQRIVAVATVGGIRADLELGHLVVPDQLIDYTHGRKNTFFEGPDQPVTHIDFTQPYDADLRQALAAAAARSGKALHDGGVYGCTQGPRLETAAEIRAMERDGCDMVGMTGMPEAALARELGLPYAALCVVINHAAGKGTSLLSISHDAIKTVMDQSISDARAVLTALHDTPVAATP